MLRKSLWRSLRGGTIPRLAARQPIRVVVIEPQALLLAAFRLLLESHPGLVVIGEATDHDEALAVVEREQPDVIVLDLDVSDAPPLELIAGLLKVAPDARVVTLTGANDAALDREAVRHGAVGLIGKAQRADVLFRAIEKVHAGEAWIDRRTVANVHRELTRRSAAPDAEDAKMAALTSREREVSSLVAEGLKNRQIAARLSIAEATVRHHLTSIFAKFGVEDRLGLVVHVYRHGLAGPSH